MQSVMGSGALPAPIRMGGRLTLRRASKPAGRLVRLKASSFAAGGQPGGGDSETQSDELLKVGRCTLNSSDPPRRRLIG